MVGWGWDLICPEEVSALGGAGAIGAAGAMGAVGAAERLNAGC